MNFFEHQYRARRRTGLLVFLFALAVLLIALTINAFFFLVASWADPVLTLRGWLHTREWIWLTLATFAVIAFGTGRTLFQLRGGGRAVAELVGARRVRSDTHDLDERRLLNIVEEMSIASGTPRPLVYVMDDEPGINAFVAGLRPTEAVLVVTRGALKELSRDELQGVIGHEYSHILNGDMRINVRLMGLLAGILLIAQIGRMLMRARDGRGRGQLVLTGLALFIIGYVGVVFASLIQAAISRQREFLADASSVQFTRNPDGIAGALWRIRQHSAGSRLETSHSQNLGHFCFGEPVKARFTSLMATHPPIEERIRRVNPRFLVLARAGAVRRPPEAPEATGPVPAGSAGFAGAGDTAAVPFTPEGIAESVGHVSPAHFAYAERMFTHLPSGLLDALHDPQRTPSVIYALVLEGMQEQARSRGIAVLVEAAGQEASDSAAALVDLVKKAGSDTHLALVNLAIPVLKERDEASRSGFLRALEKLVECDGRYTLFEFALVTILHQHLDPGAERDTAVRFYRYGDVMDEIRLLLTLMARAGASGEEAARDAFRHVMAQFERDPGEPLPGKACTLPAVEQALERLNALAPMLKKSVVEACADCVTHDGRVVPREAELLQAVSLALDCPLPPIVQT
jgi:Zn-dependent protease with chaperone function